MIAAANIGPMDVFFVFIMLTSLEPVMKQRWLEASRRFPTVEYLPGRHVAGRRIELGESSTEL